MAKDGNTIQGVGVDAIDLASLVKLKVLFGDEGELDQNVYLSSERFYKFVEAFRDILGANLSKTELTHLFMKIDANSDGSVDWEEFTNFMFLSKQSSLENGTSIGTTVAPYMELWETSFSVKTNNELGTFPETENVIQMKFVPGLNSILTASAEGLIRLWHPTNLMLLETIKVYESLKAGENKRLSNRKGNKHTPAIRPRRSNLLNLKRKSCITDVTFMQITNKIAVASSGNGIVFLDMSTDTRKISNFVGPVGLDYTTPLCLEYHFEPIRENEMLFIGTDTGEIIVYTFHELFWQIHDHDITFGTRSVFKVHTDHIVKVRFVPDLSSIVSASLDKTLNVLDIDRKRNKKTFKQHKEAVYDFVWCPIPKLVASCGLERMIMLWSPYSINSLATLDGHASTLLQLISVDEQSQLISLSKDHVLKVWDIRSQKCIQTITVKSSVKRAETEKNCILSWLHQLKIYPQRPNLSLLRQERGEQIAHKFPLVGALYNRSFLQIVSSCQHGIIKLWDLDTTKIIFTFTVSSANSNMNQRIKYPKDPRRDHMAVTDSLEEAINQANREENDQLDYSNCLTATCFDKGGRRIITATTKGDLVKIWNFSNGSLLKTLTTEHSSSEMPEAQQAAVQDLNDIANEFEGNTYDQGHKEISCVLYAVNETPRLNSGEEFAQQKYILAAGWDRKIYVWQDDSSAGEQNGKVGYHLKMPKSSGSADKEHTDDITCIIQIPPSLIASVGKDGKLIFWNLLSGEYSRMYNFSEPAMNAIFLKQHQMLIVQTSMGAPKLNFLHLSNFNILDSVTISCLSENDTKHEQQIILCTDERNEIICSAMSQGMISVWKLNFELDVNKPMILPCRTFKATSASITSIAFVEIYESIESFVLIGSSSGEISLYTLSGTKTKSFSDPVISIHPVEATILPDSIARTTLSFEERKRNFQNIHDSFKGINQTQSLSTTSEIPKPFEVWFALTDNQISDVITVAAKKPNDQLLLYRHGESENLLKHEVDLEFFSKQNKTCWQKHPLLSRLIARVFESAEGVPFKVVAASFLLDEKRNIGYSDNSLEGWRLLDIEGKSHNVPFPISTNYFPSCLSILNILKNGLSETVFYVETEENVCNQHKEVEPETTQTACNTTSRSEPAHSNQPIVNSDHHETIRKVLTARRDSANHRGTVSTTPRGRKIYKLSSFKLKNAFL